MKHYIDKDKLRRFVTQQLSHTVITAVILAALFFGAAQVGALDSVLAPAGAATDTSFTTVNYQGRLADSGGMPISAPITLQFAFYDSDTGGNLRWGPETHANVPVSEGLFSVRLGSQTNGGLPINLFNGGDLWLETNVEGETLSPRERLTAVPYAMVAGEAQTVADGAVTQAQAPSLIEAIKDNTLIQYGGARATATEATDRLSVYIDYETDFPSRPYLILQPAYNVTPWVIATWGLPCDKTGCQIFLRRADGNKWTADQWQDIHWLAIKTH